MDENTLKQLALEEAKKSKCKKRKVGAIIVNQDKSKVLAKGHNYNKGSGFVCEDSKGNTLDTVVHAEIVAINKINNFEVTKYIYVTHQPCENCQRAINKAGLEVVLVDSFMKFDSGKLRYGLIPPEVLKALASVLTYGAKKYKPDNWKEVDDTSRYVDALYRHLEAWRSGELKDSESGLSHLAHALTNVSFLLYFDEINKK